jgi:NlpC/P60 family putative phage cell wall peptidase
MHNLDALAGAASSRHADPPCRAGSEQILAAARAWLGTPWRHQGRLKGVAVDCGGLITGVGRELGLLDFDTRAYGRIPDGQQLRALCEQHLVCKSIPEAAPGDVLLMRFTRHPQHLAIVGDLGQPFSLIHAYADAGFCIEHGADSKWLRRIVSACSFKQTVS